MKVERLYLDLDGVLADFDHGVERVLGRRPAQLDMRRMWTALQSQPDFFGTLAMMHDAQQLWDFCRPLRPVILTGLPLGSWAAPQKRRWVARMLGNDVEVITCMSRDKPRWSGPGRVLVDDRASAREGWKRKGGTFVHHTSAQSTIDALRALGIDPQSVAERQG